MNPLIITIIVALGTFILAIFGATWLNQQMLKNYIDAKFEGFENTFNARLQSFEQAMNAGFETAEERNQSLQQQLTMLVSRVERLERQLDQIFKSFLPRG